MNGAERLFSGAECRAEGRTLIGPAMRFGDISPSHRERFEAGAIDLTDGLTRWLDIGHDRSRLLAWCPGGGLELRTTADALEVAATLPTTPVHDAALAGVRDGRFTGFSVEFHSLSERREGGLRVIERAKLDGIGLVSAPSYPGSTVEARAELRASGLRGSIPYGAALQCRCHPGEANVVRFTPGAFRESIATRNVLAIIGQYDRAIASTSKGSLRIRETRAGIEVEIDRLPDTQAARDLVEQADVVPLYVRPIYRTEDSADFTEADGVATYKRATLRAILIGATDEDSGFDEAIFTDPADVPARRRAARRLWL